MSIKLTIALAGNPNSGKSTLFQKLTGGKVHIGNWPGVTIEKLAGVFQYKDYDLQIIDLPGTYSLTSYSLEEVIARDNIIFDKPDLVISVVDASDLEKHLYLYRQIRELEVPTLLVFNKIDRAEKYGLDFDFTILSQLLDTPIITTVADQNKGIDDLKQKIIDILIHKKIKLSTKPILFQPELEKDITKLQAILIKESELIKKYSCRWLAIKLLEQDPIIKQECSNSALANELISQINASIHRLGNIYSETIETIIADNRYGFIHGILKEGIKKQEFIQKSYSDALDKIVLHKYFGLPIFLFLMWLLFQTTFSFAKYPSSWLESLFHLLGNMIKLILPQGFLQDLITEGIIGGVGSVIVFVPNILFLFLAIAILEDSGYMSRAAFVMDKWMHKIGLHGKSFIPMLIGFGCTVPALMATRILENKRDRLLTMFLVSFMSCSARFPVYVLLAGAFFPEHIAGNVIFSIYIFGIIIAVIVAKILNLALPGETIPFVLELPPYRTTKIKGLLIHMWERGWLYLRKAGTIILFAAVLFWFLGAYPKPPSYTNPNKTINHSYIGKIGHAIEPVFKPLGFDWKIDVALFSGLAAKEIVVASLGTLYGLEEEAHSARTLKAALLKDPTFTPLVAYTLMIFVLLYVPCFSAIITFYNEAKSLSWTLFYVSFTIAIAYIVSFLIYRLGLLLGF